MVIQIYYHKLNSNFLITINMEDSINIAEISFMTKLMQLETAKVREINQIPKHNY